ncbi:MAG: acyltransferase family protein [Mycobacteriales bacterium]
MSATTETAPDRTAAAATPAAAHTGLVYRPALDGVRALAVYLVLAFHAGSSTLSGGFIGVDTFFVLSGYLVTRVILTDMARGRFDLVQFYGRRVRRLLPAALAVLVLVSLTWLALASPVDRAAIVGDARASALYFSNWHFAHTATDYFAANDNPTPLLHFWSLSVEEQFYLFWPLTLLLVWVVSKKDRRRALPLIALVAGVGAVLSLLALALTVHAHHQSLAYYGTHTRAYQLLVGALLAVTVETALSRGREPGRRAWVAGPLQVAFLVGLVVLATRVVTVGPSVRGVAAAVAAVGLLATLEHRPQAGAARLLSLGPVTFLGKISYGTYLWHYPVLVVVRRFAEMSSLALTVVGGVVATALAALSYQLLELPIRRSPVLGRHSRLVAVSGLAASLVAGVVVLPTVLHDRRLPVIAPAGGVSAAALHAASDPRVVPVQMAGFDAEKATRIPAGSPADGPALPDPSCTKVPVAQCIAVHGTGKRVLLLGDSHAGMLLPAFRAIAKRENATLAVASRPGCPWQQALLFTHGNDEDCKRVKKTWYRRVIPDFDPDVIVLATRATDHKVGASYSVKSLDPSLPTDPSGLLVAATRQSLTALARPGRLLVVVEPVPVDPQHALSCLSGVRVSTSCAFETEGLSPAETGYRALARELPGVRTVDLDPLACPRLPVCDPIVDGFVVRRDHDHLTPAWSAYIADDVDTLLRRAGVF